MWVCFGLTGMIGPSKPARNMLRANTEPTEPDRLLAPISAMDRGRNRKSKLRIDITRYRNGGEGPTLTPARPHGHGCRHQQHVAGIADQLVRHHGAAVDLLESKTLVESHGALV